MGYVSETFQPDMIGLTLFVGANAGLTPERVVVEAAARFDREGYLDRFSGSTNEGNIRFERLRESLGQSIVTVDTLRQALRSVGAPFAERAPSPDTCSALGVVTLAIGQSLELSEPVSEPLTPDRNAEYLSRRDVTWRIEGVARRSTGSKRVRLNVDPWGELLVVYAFEP
jgi:hypothetical protein